MNLTNAALAALAVAQQDLLCAQGLCAHYGCTEGRSLVGRFEPEPTTWDYRSEAFSSEAAFDFYEGEV